MTIPISRLRLGIALLFPVVGIRIGGIFLTNSSGQRFIGWDVPELVAIALGWLLVAAGIVGILQLIPQMVDPDVGVEWDNHSVKIRAGVGPKRQSTWENIESATASSGLIQTVRLETAQGPDLVVPVYLLELPEGWTIETLAGKLAR